MRKDMNNIKKELYKIISNKIIWVALLIILAIPFIISFIEYFTRIDYLNYWTNSYYIIECNSESKFLEEIENAKKAIEEIHTQFVEGFLTTDQYEDGVIMANKRVSIYEYMMNNNIDFNSSAPLDGIFYSNNPNNSLYFINFYFSGVTLFSIMIITFLSSTILNTSEFDLKVAKYVYQGSINKRGKIQRVKFFVVFMLAFIIFIFDCLLLLAFASPFDSSIKTILIIKSETSIIMMSSSLVTFYIVLSYVVESIFYLLIFFSISRLISNLFISVISQVAFCFLFSDLPTRINNHFFSLLTKPFFNLIVANYSTGEIVTNIVFKLVIAIGLFTLSSVYVRKREI